MEILLIHIAYESSVHKGRPQKNWIFLTCRCPNVLDLPFSLNVIYERCLTINLFLKFELVVPVLT